MNIPPFKLERYFAAYEFSAPWLLCSSDCEAAALKEILDLADSQCLDLWNQQTLGYTESQGLPLLRKEISQIHEKISPEQILVLVPGEGIFIAMNCLLESGDHIICPAPAYQSLYQTASSSGCAISFWKPCYADGNWDYRIEDLEKLIVPETKMIVINFPHNPTGATINKNKLEKLVALAKEKDIIIFSDEMYRFLEYFEKDRLPSISDVYEKGISLNGMSKSLSLPGIRIGWVSTQDRLIFEKLAVYKDYTTICNSAPSELLALIGLRNRETLWKNNLDLIEKNLLYLDDFFKRFPDLFVWKRPVAGPIAFPEWKGEGDAVSFCHDLVEKQGVMLVPANQYDYGDRHFRIGFGRKNMPEALNELEKYLTKI